METLHCVAVWNLLEDRLFYFDAFSAQSALDMARDLHELEDGSLKVDCFTTKAVDLESAKLAYVQRKRKAMYA